MDMQNLQNMVGQKVACPKCGKEGIVAVDTFRAKGKTYRYLVIRHYMNGKTHRCVIGKLDSEQASESAKPAKQESLVLGEKELEAIFAYSIRKKNYTQEQANTAKQVLHEIVEKGRQAGKVTVIFG